MFRYVYKCEFIGSIVYKVLDRDFRQVVCFVREEERNDVFFIIKLSNDFFVEDKIEFKGEVQEFVIMSEFIVVVGEDVESGDLYVFVSFDGKYFEFVNFLLNFNKDYENVYILLDSFIYVVNLFVCEYGEKDCEYGFIIKSNLNGILYVFSVVNVNCNYENYVDFEKVFGFEGVVFINVVVNLGKKEKIKKLQIKILYNDGLEWGYFVLFVKDVDGKLYKCSSVKGDVFCVLYVYYYIERDDKRNIFVVSIVVGFIFGIGNVGFSFGDIEKVDMFMSNDGGVIWMSVKKGYWIWQYGD